MDLVTQARHAQERLDEVLNDAFGFLVEEHNYEAMPLRKGGSPYHQFTKRYHLGGRCISFYCDYDHPNTFGLILSPVDLWSRRELHPELRYRDSWHLSLESMLEMKEIDVSIPRFDSTTEAASFYADQLKRNLADEIGGDFRAYAPIVFTVELVRVAHPDGKSVKLGEYQEITAAERSALRTVEKMSLGRLEYVEIVGRFLSDRLLQGGRG